MLTENHLLRYEIEPLGGFGIELNIADDSNNSLLIKYNTKPIWLLNTMIINHIDIIDLESDDKSELHLIERPLSTNYDRIFIVSNGPNIYLDKYDHTALKLSKTTKIKINTIPTHSTFIYAEL